MQFNKWVWLLGVLVVVLISVVIKNRSGKPEGNDVSAERIESARTAQRISSPRSDDSDAMPFSVPAAPASISHFTDRLAGLEGGSLEYHQTLKEITTIWGEKDPAALAEWLFELEQKGGAGVRMAISEMTKIWASKDPLGAIDHFESSALATESQRMIGISVVLMEWGREDPEAAWDRLNTTPLMADDSNVATEILSSWAEVDALAAAEQIAGLVSSGDDQAHMGNLAVEALLAEPEGISGDEAEAAQLERVDYARLWLEALPVDSAARSVATSRLLGSWLSVDPQAASQWLVDQPESAARTNGIRSMANAITVKDPESAVIWAMELPQGNAQMSTLGRAYDYWFAKDPVAAQEYANANFDEALLKAISGEGEDGGEVPLDEDITELE